MFPCPVSGFTAYAVRLQSGAYRDRGTTRRKAEAGRTDIESIRSAITRDRGGLFFVPMTADRYVNCSTLRPFLSLFDGPGPFPVPFASYWTCQRLARAARKQSRTILVNFSRNWVSVNRSILERVGRYPHRSGAYSAVLRLKLDCAHPGLWNPSMIHDASENLELSRCPFFPKRPAPM